MNSIIKKRNIISTATTDHRRRQYRLRKPRITTLIDSIEMQKFATKQTLNAMQEFNEEKMRHANKLMDFIFVNENHPEL